MPGTRGFFDSLSNLVGDAISDAREKLVEEGWFGKPTTRQLTDFDAFLDRFYDRESDLRSRPEQDGMEIER